MAFSSHPKKDLLERDIPILIFTIVHNKSPCDGYDKNLCQKSKYNLDTRCNCLKLGEIFSTSRVINYSNVEYFNDFR